MTKARSLSDFIESDGSVTLVDNQKIKVGTGNDLEIYHSGSKSYIKDAGTGNLAILTNTLELNNAADSQNMIVVNEGGAVTLYHGGSAKLATKATGINITGDTDTDTLTVSGVSTFANNINISSASYGYQIAGTSVLGYSGGNVIVGDLGAGVALEYGGSTKLTTVTGGVEVTGYMDADNFKINGGQGSDGQVLTSTGSGVAWEDSSGTTINNNADNRVITGSGTSGTLNAEGDLTFDGNELSVGAMKLGSTIVHTGDTDTIIGFDTNTINFTTGNVVGMSMIGGVNYMAGTPTAPSGSAERSYIYHNNASNTSLHIGTQYGVDAAAIKFETRNITRMQIDGDGTVQIGNPAVGSAQNLVIMPQGKLFLDAGGDTYIHEYSANEMGFVTGGGTRLKLSGGNLHVATGNVVIDGNGNGIDFSAHAHLGGKSSELLDDYEEGTFTPTYTVAGGGTAGTVTGTNVGTYTKVGRMCTVAVTSNYVPTSGTIPTSYSLALPFAASNTGGQSGTGFGQETGQSGAGVLIGIPNNSASAVIWRYNGSAVPANSYFSIGFTYQTT
jgi:hypothetical protein